MNYYTAKKEAYMLIDDLVKDGNPIEIIYFKIATIYGFSKKTVDERIEMLKNISVPKKNVRAKTKL